MSQLTTDFKSVPELEFDFSFKGLSRDRAFKTCIEVFSLLLEEFFLICTHDTVLKSFIETVVYSYCCFRLRIIIFENLLTQIGGVFTESISILHTKSAAICVIS